MLHKITLSRLIALAILSMNIANADHRFHHPQALIASLKGDKQAGRKIYQNYCASCHAAKPLIPLGAPRFRHCDDWKPRLKAGIKTLHQHTFEGLNNMPARGGCFECSDKLLKQAVAYMLPKSKQTQ